MYNRRQNELRQFAQNWAFYVLLTSKGGNKALISSPIPSMQCCSAVRATYRKQNTPTLNGVVRGGVRILLFSHVTLFEYNISTLLSPIVGIKN